MTLPAALFDLDGTLIDSIELILNSARYAFEGRPGPRPTDDEWLAGVGTPLAAMFAKYAENEADVQALIAKYREYQIPNHDRLTRPYPGVADTIAELHRRGFPLGVVTSKTELMAKKGLTLVGIRDYFDAIIGCDSTKRNKPDPEPVIVAAQQLGQPPENAVFVGDSVHDMAAGNAAGAVTVAALWGPFSRDDLRPSAPRHFLENITGLPALLDGLNTGGNRSSA